MLMVLSALYSTVLMETIAHNNVAGGSKSIFWYLTSSTHIICEPAPWQAVRELGVLAISKVIIFSFIVPPRGYYSPVVLQRTTICLD